MGTYKKGVLGAFSGKVGTVVGSSWNGIEYMRSLPKPSSKPATQMQLEQRARFGIATDFLSAIAPLANAGFKRESVRKTGFNLAISHLIGEGITGTYPDFGIDYHKVLFSKGPLEPAWDLEATSTQETQIELSWRDNTGFGTAKETDRSVILVYNPAKQQFVYNLNSGAERAVGEDVLSLPAAFSGDTVEVWMAFMTSDRNTFSTSAYVGQVVIF